MNLYPSIGRRKACREYDMRMIGDEMLSQIGNAIRGFAPLYPDLKLPWRLTDKVKGLFHVKAPHYLVISGQGQEGEKESTGFIFQQLALWLDAMGIGSIWLGKATDYHLTTRNDIITIGFGYTAEPVHRAKEEFKRRPIDQITNAPDDICIKAAHLAPSGLNRQPWYWDKKRDKVFVYQQKLTLPLSLLYKSSDIDMGIALCHYAVACQEISGKRFSFVRSTKMPIKPGYVPFGIIV